MKLGNVVTTPLVRHTSLGAWGITLTAIMASSLALATPPPARQNLIMPPGRSVAANDQSSAIFTNPANLGYLPATEVRWNWTQTGEGSPDPARGHAFDLALALPAHIGTGL